MIARMKSAAIGARISIASITIGFDPPSRSSRLPPKNIAVRETIMMVAAIVAAMVLVRMSRFFTCASSCAITPSSSLSLSTCMMPCVAATAACDGLRPVAKALGDGSGMM